MSFVIVSRLHSDAPAKWKAQWKRLLLAAPHESSQLLKQLATKSGMPLLRRAEGGIGDDNNKQLRFERAPPYLDFGDLRAALVNPVEADAWSFQEAQDMRDMVQACLDDHLKCSCVECVIVIS
jgi:hypothetical protein